MDRIKNFFSNIQQRIAFYPTLIALGGALLAFLMVYLERQQLSSQIMEIAPHLVIRDKTIAQILLSTFIGGLISLMVFSFSQVMLLLNQASSNFSPRVLPGLVSDSRNQLILGLYLGVILYNILILVFLHPQESSYETAGFSVLLSIGLTVLALASFIFFIHHISRSIQVGTIVKSIKDRTLHQLKKELPSPSPDMGPTADKGQWLSHVADRTGYFQGILSNELLSFCKKEQLKINIAAFKGQFVTAGTTVFKTNRPISEVQRQSILGTFLFSQEEMGGSSYEQGFRQIAEIGIKAMSPGINDPGTALNSIDALTELFIALAEKNNETLLLDADGTHWATLTSGSFPRMLYNVMATYRTYCTHDVIVVQKLLGFLSALSTKVVNSEQQEVIALEIKNLLADAKESIGNTRDLQKMNRGFKGWS
jgi:uncharacterized membrane protein